jgi:hypothetical protein
MAALLLSVEAMNSFVEKPFRNSPQSRPFGWRSSSPGNLVLQM